MFFATLLLATTSANAAPSPSSALNEFTAAWSGIGSYSATLTMHETEGNDVQDRTYAYTFAKPANATIAITAGPGRGGKVSWSGGDDVTGSPPGILGAIKVHMSLHDHRVTSLRGDTVAMASFGWLRDHLRRTKGTITQMAGPEVRGVATSEVGLAVTDPSADDGVTREVVLLSQRTHLPVEFERYVGASLVKDIRYSDVVTSPTH
ncbi:MAG: hypothetical protein GIX03_05325 [Candidatus Eremiobacteraeota bacterium]|nr:hypothetical protein [Candidatus Eremiobacteraeota bacterium]MBC5802419.1 hypothetical protein [Candidatus Eremiobacteraeota bacterium]MBC5820637.1 hypothetical protein [Candidatus Eremiobacteraeota bacterium]